MRGYTRITNQIIAALEKGTKPWMQPWNAAHAAGAVSRPLRFNGQPYSGINILSLWASAMGHGFAAPIWMTFKQAIELGGCVRKGEKGSPVVYANTLVRTETDPETGEDQDQAIPFLKAYTVFNVDQIEGLPDHFYALADGETNPDQRIETAEAFFAATGADMRDHPPTVETAKDLAFLVITAVGESAIRQANPAYSRQADYLRVQSGLIELLRECADDAEGWGQVLDCFEGKGQVQLMTIHKSKGMEFHTMIFFGLDNQSWWSLSPQRKEELNSFFVAFTRARQRAFFTCCIERGGPITWLDNVLGTVVPRVAGCDD